MSDLASTIDALNMRMRLTVQKFIELPFKMRLQIKLNLIEFLSFEILIPNFRNLNGNFF